MLRVMFSHIHVGVSDLNRAFGFYARVLGALGLTLKFCDPKIGWAAWKRPGVDRPLFLIGLPSNGAPAECGNGQMTAFQAPDRETVDKVYEAALAAGGSCEGPPGLRPHYHPNYYGAYFRDLDGNKLCVVNHGE